MNPAPSPHPGNDRLQRRALAALPGGNTRTTVFVPPHPPYAVRGEGCEIVDADGVRVLDLLNNYTALVHGHAHPEVVQAAVGAVEDGSCFGLPTEHEVALAERLRDRVPTAAKWRFTNSGSEAVMMAIRLARAATGRSAVLRFQGAYHGSYDAAVQPPTRGVPASVTGEIITVHTEDTDGLSRTLEQHAGRLACVMFDAMPNRAGLRPASEEFVALLREETRRHDVLLIQDEVITLRMARGGIHSTYGIEPDIITVGKVIGGGFPIGGLGGREELMALFDPRQPDPVIHPGTFSANPVSMRAGAVSLDLLTDERIEQINDLGDRLRLALDERGWEVSGKGSLLRVRVPEPQRLWWALYREGVLIANNGLMCISTAMGDGELRRALAAFDRVATKAGPVSSPRAPHHPSDVTGE